MGPARMTSCLTAPETHPARPPCRNGKKDAERLRNVSHQGFEFPAILGFQVMAGTTPPYESIGPAVLPFMA